MKRLLVGIGLIFAWSVAFAACAHERPPPRMCETEPPPKKKEEVRIGTCPVEWGHDAGSEAEADASPDAHPDG